MKLQPQAESLSGLPQPLVPKNPATILAKRAPTTTDTGYPLGIEWLDKVGGNLYFLLAVAAGSATWLTVNGGSGSFSTLTVTGLSTLGAVNGTGTFSINGSGSATSSIGAGIATGAVSIGNTTGGVALNGLVTVGTGIVYSNAGATSGTTTATLNNRIGQVTITTPSIAAGATFTMTISNTQIAGSSTQVGYWLTGGTTGAALTIQSYTNTANQSAVVIQNGTGATTNTASLILNFLVLN